MHDAIECPQCGKRYPWKATFVGRNVKCRGCQCEFTVSAPEPPQQKADNPLADLFTEEFAKDVMSAEAVMNESAGLAATGANPTTLAPIRPKRKRRPSQSGPGIGASVAKHKLILAVIVVTLTASGLTAFSGVVVPAMAMLMVGLVIAATGLLPYPARNESKSGHFVVIGLFVCIFGNLVHKAYMGEMHIPNTENVAIYVAFVVGILFGLLIIGVIVFLIGLVFRRYGFFRAAAGAHMVLALVLAATLAERQRSVPTAHPFPLAQRNDLRQMTAGSAEMNFRNPSGSTPRAGRMGNGEMGMADTGNEAANTSNRQRPEPDPLMLAKEFASGSVDPERLEEIAQEMSRQIEPDERDVLRKLLAGPVDPERQEEVTQQLLTSLAGGDHFVRIDAIKALGRWHTDEALPELIELLTDEDTFVSDAAFEALEGSKDIRAIEAVARLWATGDNSMRARRTLEAMGPAAEETVLKYLNVQDTMQFMQAMQLLEQIGTQRCLPRLAELARTGDFLTATSVQTTGRQIVSAGRTPEDPIQSSAGSPQNSDAAGGPTPPDASLADKAVAALKSDDPARRVSAAEKLAEMPAAEEHRPPIAQALTDLLSDRQETVRAAAMKALGTWHTEQSIPKMVERLDDESSEVYDATMDSLSKTQDIRAAAALAEQLDGTNPDKAASYLETMGPIAEDAVSKYLDHTNPTTLVMACRALAKIGTQKSLAKLDALADHENLSVGTAALKAAVAIRSNP